MWSSWLMDTNSLIVIKYVGSILGLYIKVLLLMYLLFSILYIIYLKTELKTLFWSACLLSKKKIWNAWQKNWSHQKNWHPIDKFFFLKGEITTSRKRLEKWKACMHITNLPWKSCHGSWSLSCGNGRREPPQTLPLKTTTDQNIKPHLAHLSNFLCVIFKEHEKSLDLEDFLDILHPINGFRMFCRAKS